MNIMTKDIERIYGRAATRFVRDPRSPRQAHRLPIRLAFPDYPVAKYEKHSLRDVAINDGLHFHSFDLIHPASRLTDDFAEHLKQWQGLYVRDEYPLARIEAEKVETDPAYVIDYLAKWTRRGRFSPSDLLVLPRSISELSAQRRRGAG